MSHKQILARFPCPYYVNIIINIRKTIINCDPRQFKTNLIAPNRNYRALEKLLSAILTYNSRTTAWLALIGL